MKTLFGKLLISFALIIVLIIISGMVVFFIVYSRSYEEQIIVENYRHAQNTARALNFFIAAAYNEVESLAHNIEVISMDTERQTEVFVCSIRRNPYFELLYAQGMDGMQTGRSSGALGNRRERWWFIRMLETGGRPFVSESYYSVTTSMPSAAVFYPIMRDGEMIGIMGGDMKLSALHEIVVETANEGSWTYILDGKGVVVAHPDTTFQEELYNYVRLTRTVTVRDTAGNPIQTASGNLTEELPLDISDAYKAAFADMLRGNISSAKFREGGRTLYLSYRVVPMQGYSDPWYVISVKDGNIAMRTRNIVIFAILGSSVLIILRFFISCFHL